MGECLSAPRGLRDTFQWRVHASRFASSSPRLGERERNPLMRSAPAPRRPRLHPRALATSLAAVLAVLLLAPISGLRASPEDTAAKLKAAERPARDSLSLAQRTKDAPAGAPTQIAPLS